MREYHIKESRTGCDRLSVDYRGLLNDAQYEAVTAEDGPMLVVAGAGSGKTRTLVHRAAYLVENGAAPESILLLTFTRKAAQEMMRRAAGILDERCQRIAGGTFHGFANNVLRRYGRQTGYGAGFTILDQGDAEDVIELVSTEPAKDAQGQRLQRRLPKKNSLHAMHSRAVNSGRPLQEIVAEEYPQFLGDLEDIEAALARYQAYKKERQMMDYDDLLVVFDQLLREHPDVREALSRKYRHILVDEFQDTNQLQANIVRQLACTHQNVMAVGDDAQSIYAFRGATVRNILDFPASYPGARIIKLEQNYRSTQPILAFTNAVIAHMKEKYGKVLFSDQSGGQKPGYLEPRDVYEQAAFVAQRVLELREEDVRLRDIAVLFRAAFHSNELEVELQQRNIPFRKFGGMRFVEAAHVKDLLAFMRVLFNPKDAPAWMRLLKLHEGIGARTASTILAPVVDQGQGIDGLLDRRFQSRKFAEGLKRLHAALGEVRQSQDPGRIAAAMANYYLPLLRAVYRDDFQKREGDVESVVRLAERAQTLEQFLSEFSLDPPQAIDAAPADEEEDYLVLSTIHSAKGLEWHAVFMISLMDGYLPAYYALRKDEALEEERRIFYVAATRAQQELYLLKPSTIELRTQALTAPSRFLEEAVRDGDLVEEWRLRPF